MSQQTESVSLLQSRMGIYVRDNLQEGIIQTQLYQGKSTSAQVTAQGMNSGNLKIDE